MNVYSTEKDKLWLFYHPELEMIQLFNKHGYIEYESRSGHITYERGRPVIGEINYSLVPMSASKIELTPDWIEIGEL